MNSPHNLESFDKKNSVGNDEQDVNGDGEQRKYSDDIVAELLREVGNSEKPFKLEDLARTSDVTPKKVHKEKKEHKKDKKKKKKKRKHEKHERSRSPESRKKHKKGRKHRSRSSSCEENLKNGPVQRKPLEAMKSKVMEEEDDDLPLCSDLKVAKETKLVINIKSVLNKKSNGVDKGNQAATKKDLPTESGSEAMDVDSPSRRIEKTESEEYGPLPPNISKDKESRNGKDSRTSKIIEKTVARINQKEGSKSKPKKNRSRSVSSSDSEKKEAHRSGRHKRERSRSRDRNSRSYKTRRSSRSRSKDRRKRSRSRSYDRRRSRRRYSKSRSRSRSKSRSDDRIDKARLLEIAQSKAQRIKSMDMLDPRSGVPKSIDDFVSYCEKLQKSQEQEERREKEGIVSSGSDTELEGFPARVKQAEPIKIKISNGNSALVVNNDRALGASVMFPVSSGNLHRDHIDLQWKRVDPSKTPLTCSVEQKKFLGTTSLEADKRKLTGQQKNPVLPLIPPPPLPPSSLLPPPPTPPVFAKNLCPPPPPMPSLLVLPESDDTIKLDSSAPSSDNIAQVVTQRLVALKALNENPNDYDARKTLNTADQQMALWANVKCLPGKFTGSTGVSVLSTEELQPSDPRFHAWAKKGFDAESSYSSG